jgi:hypothetical protein
VCRLSNLSRVGYGLEVGGRRVELRNPRVVRDPARRSVPAPVRAELRLIAVDLFLEFDPKTPRSRA